MRVQQVEKAVDGSGSDGRWAWAEKMAHSGHGMGTNRKVFDSVFDSFCIYYRSQSWGFQGVQFHVKNDSSVLQWLVFLGVSIDGKCVPSFKSFASGGLCFRRFVILFEGNLL